MLLVRLDRGKMRVELVVVWEMGVYWELREMLEDKTVMLGQRNRLGRSEEEEVVNLVSDEARLVGQVQP